MALVGTGPGGAWAMAGAAARAKRDAVSSTLRIAFFPCASRGLAASGWSSFLLVDRLRITAAPPGTAFGCMGGHGQQHREPNRATHRKPAIADCRAHRIN